MRHLRSPFRIIRANLTAYLVLNAIGYGLLLAGMAAGAVFPDLNAANTAGLTTDGTADQVLSLMSNVWLFAVTIFAVNVFTVALPMIVLPSLIVPFAGIVIFGWKAFDIGITLAPTSEATTLLLIPHSVTMLIEFQAYILVLLAGYVHAMAWLRPATVGAERRRQGYLRGLQQLGRLCLLALVLFVVGAVYEAFELVHLVPAIVAR